MCSAIEPGRYSAKRAGPAAHASCALQTARVYASWSLSLPRAGAKAWHCRATLNRRVPRGRSAPNEPSRACQGSSRRSTRGTRGHTSSRRTCDRSGLSSAAVPLRWRLTTACAPAQPTGKSARTTVQRLVSLPRPRELREGSSAPTRTDQRAERGACIRAAHACMRPHHDLA